ncbi:MAG: hypothetical protein GTO17_10285 [Candidatus Aminicenantes bacterium]|nr:hypothetical protein [Candidatus Aminicenantes bacterium]
MKKTPMRNSNPPAIKSTIFPILVGGKIAETRTIPPSKSQKRPMILKGEKSLFIF